MLYLQGLKAHTKLCVRVARDRHVYPNEDPDRRGGAERALGTCYELCHECSSQAFLQGCGLEQSAAQVEMEEGPFYWERLKPKSLAR